MPIGVNYVVSSGTTYQGKPPSFSVVHLDPDTMLPVDFETFAFDLDHANAHDEPIWRHMWNFKEVYEIEDLSP